MIGLLILGLAVFAWVTYAHSFALLLAAHAPAGYAQPFYQYGPLIFAGLLLLAVCGIGSITQGLQGKRWSDAVWQTNAGRRLELLREPYSGRRFPGYDDIDLSFEELEALVRNARPDWMAALESMKGIYLISDTATGKRYVGSAYGDQGIWSRWCNYAASGHGGNVELRALVTNPSLEYCRANFRFALLEHRSARTPDEVILAREVFWKRILLTRGERGLNRN